jgi:hypothetical protein
VPGWTTNVPPWFQPAGSRPRAALDRARIRPTLAVAAVILAVVLGGFGLDNAIAAPSAGTVNVGGPVWLTAASGWVEAPGDEDGSTSGLKLQKGDAILYAVMVTSGYRGTAAQALRLAEGALDDGSAQINFSSVKELTFGGYPAAAVGFVAIISNQQRSMMVDGELVMIVADGYLVEIQAAAPQGDFEPVVDDLKSMLNSVEVRQ